MNVRAFLRCLITLALLGVAPAVFAQAQPGLPLLTGTAGGQSYSLPVQTLVFLMSLGLLPAIILMMSSFTRIIIVLSLLRHALGTQTSPPNQVLIGLALFLTFFIMSPVLDKVYTDAYVPLCDSKTTVEQTMDTAVTPLRQFMLKQTREPNLALFVKMGNMPTIASPEQTPICVLIPAFVTSKLRNAFQIGFATFIPFLVIDIVVAAVLMSMGMMMVTPPIFLLPFKIILFVLVDGWCLLLGLLAQSFMQ